MVNAAGVALTANFDDSSGKEGGQTGGLDHAKVYRLPGAKQVPRTYQVCVALRYKAVVPRTKCSRHAIEHGK